MAKCRQGVPEEGRAGNYSWYRSIYGIIMRIATNLVSKDRKSSEAQRLTQLAIANLIILWRAFHDMLKPTFRNRPQGETECNAFVRQNWELARVFLTKEKVKHGACVIPPVTINIGTLTDPIKYWKDSTNNRVVTNLLLGDLVIDENTTVGQFTQALIHNNPKGLFSDQKKSYLNFFIAHQSIDIDTHYPTASVTGRHLMLNVKSHEKLWEVLGGSEGFLSYKGHLATPYATMNLYAWVRLEQNDRDEYRGTTQNLLGDNNAMLAQYTSLSAFEEACQSHGGFGEKFLTPYRANINPFHYDLPTEETVEGQNPTDQEAAAQQKVQLTFAVNNSSLGQVSLSSGEYVVGTELSVTASVKSGVSAEFTGWSDGVNTATRTIVVPAEPTTYTANFRTVSQGGGDLG